MIEALRLLPLLLLTLGLIVGFSVAAIVRAALRPTTKGIGYCLAHGLPTEPADLNANGHERALPLAHGHTTTAWEVQGHGPHGPVVLLAHGHSASRHLALGMMPPLLPHAARVVAPDLPGHGDATNRRCTIGVAEPDDLAAMLHELRAELQPGQPLVLFGVSMGAQTAIAAAARPDVRDHLDGLVCLGVYRRFMQPFPGHLRRQGLPTWPFVVLSRWAFRMMLGPGFTYDRRDDAANLACPSLFLHGERDDLCPLVAAQELHATAQDHHGDSHLVVFPDGGHTQLHRTHPELFAEAVGDFLRRVRNTTDPSPSAAASCDASTTLPPSTL